MRMLYLSHGEGIALRPPIGRGDAVIDHRAPRSPLCEYQLALTLACVWRGRDAARLSDYCWIRHELV